MNIAIIFAGGIGQRLNNGENSTPKQFLKINDKPIIIRTLELFQTHKDIDKIYISIHPDYYEYMQELVKYYYITKTSGIVNGGKTGQESIYNALKLAQKENPQDSIVLIHDGVRPNITEEVITKNIECTKKNGNAITCTSCFETILISENGINPEHVPYRKDTYAAQAPQTFHLGEVIEAHEITRKTNPNYTDIVDTCTLYKTLDKKTFMVKGNRGNIKITTIEDLYILRALIRYKEDLEAFGEQ
ncbi:MAG TPA: 2-C-methyl-D-erythritol 4-phosphate cytidylyltransferase [Cyanobacteria bacterium UBA10660]|nr:MAG TPA: 2-C-methyl-D-erythritol 4-phosphate cytidylyltransferase [Candidatus Gastranaerophilales bacterium HUM_1]HAS93685.1 2-C-methyl-D-erythritol 4-phosphate cytidylyltransferase [Cyanobacteria bacterium UBA10660]